MRKRSSSASPPLTSVLRSLAFGWTRNRCQQARHFGSCQNPFHFTPREWTRGSPNRRITRLSPHRVWPTCMSGLAQRTHHLSSEVTPTISLLFVAPLCYVVLCVVIAINCLCIIYSLATWWLKSKTGVLFEAAKKVGTASTPALSAEPLLLTHPTLLCERLCLLCEKRSESH